MERFEQGELFRDGERCVVGQHHAARADPDAFGDGSEVRDEQRR